MSFPADIVPIEGPRGDFKELWYVLSRKLDFDTTDKLLLRILRILPIMAHILEMANPDSYGFDYSHHLKYLSIDLIFIRRRWWRRPRRYCLTISFPTEHPGFNPDFRTLYTLSRDKVIIVVDEKPLGTILEGAKKMSLNPVSV